MSTAQAVTPGQGQTVNIAGVEVGEISSVELKDGKAVIGMKIEPQVQPHLPQRDRAAAAQDRPEGHGRRARRRARADAGRLPEGGAIPVSQTLPDVNLDEILASLDADTRDYLTHAAQRRRARALRGNGRAAARRRSGASSRPRATRARSTSALAKRRRNIKRVVHNFSLLTDELGARDDAARRLRRRTRTPCSRRSRARTRTCARSLQQAAGRARTTTQTTLGKVERAGRRARADAGGAAARRRARSGRRCARRAPFLRKTTPIIRDEIRPFARAALPTVKELRPALQRPRGGDAGPHARRSRSSTGCSTSSPTTRRAQQEGFLFWRRVGRTTSATRSSPRRTRTARSAAACSCCRCQDAQLLDAVAAGQPAARHAGRAAQRARRSDLPEVDPGAGGRRLMSKSAPSFGRIAAMVVLRAVVLRAAAVPVARVRRPGPAEAEGLPLHTRRSPRRRSSPRRPTCGSPACRSARSRRSSRTRRPGRSDVDDPARLALRAAAVGREGDPAPEDAAGRDLRRAHAGHADAPSRSPRAGALPASQVSADRRARRDPARLRRAARAPRSRTGCRRRRRRSTATGRDLNDALGNLGPFAEDTATLVDILNRQQGAVHAADLQHRRRVRRADRARRPAALADRELQHGVRRPPRRATASSSRRSSRCRRSSASRARRCERLDAVRRQTRTRWSPSCGRRRAS